MGETGDVDGQIFYHLLAELADHAVLLLALLVFLLEGVLHLWVKILGEMQEGPAGEVEGVEVELRTIDVAQLEFPQEVLLPRLELEFPHLKGHMIKCCMILNTIILNQISAPKICYVPTHFTTQQKLQAWQH